MDAMCEGCRRLGVGHAQGATHAALVHRGVTQPVQKGRESNREAHFRCVNCETHWIKEFDRWGTDIGFKLAP